MVLSYVQGAWRPVVQRHTSFTQVAGGGGGGGEAMAPGLTHWSETAEGHLIPNGSDQTIGSLDNPVKEVFITGNTLYVDGKPLALNEGGKLTFDGKVLATEGDGSAAAQFSELESRVAALEAQDTLLLD